MIPLPFAAQRIYAVFGLARTGLSVARALVASGATVWAWDDSEAARLAAADLPLIDLHAADLSSAAALVVAPGVPLTHPAPHPLVARAHDAAVPVIGDTELFAQARAWLPPTRVVGVTGTNGKSTTTALIHHVLVEAGTQAQLGGNIGLPILGEEPLAAGGVYVLELSSFQLDLTDSLACEVAVITNMSPDHLDRHGDMAGYAAAKRRLFAMQRAEGVAVVGQDDDWSAAMAKATAGRVIAASGVHAVHTPRPDSPPRGGREQIQSVTVIDGQLRVDGVVIARQADWPRLAGPHNGQNAACAFAACEALGVAPERILAAFASFQGLPHRMQWVAEIGGVTYINDSKATNPTSTAPALAAFPSIHWIAGGRRKTDELEACMPYLGHVRAAYLIGEAEETFAALLAPHVAVERAGTLERAVALAAEAARPGDVVLLSPACASQDQYKDYEARGAAFAAAVGRLGRAKQREVKA